jgi:hypothetical protein
MQATHILKGNFTGRSWYLDQSNPGWFKPIRKGAEWLDGNQADYFKLVREQTDTYTLEEINVNLENE